MKKFYFIGFTLMLSVVFLTSCGGKGPKEVEKEKTVEELKADSISAFIDKRFVPLDEFEGLMTLFEDLWSNPSFSSGEVFDVCFKNVEEELFRYGFEIKKKDDQFLITGTRNCDVETEDYVYYAIKAEKLDSLSSAYIFRPMGDFYVVGEIVLPSEDLYNGMVEKIKAAGYKADGDNLDFCDGDKTSPYYEEKYSKDLFYFTCNKARKTVALHYDWEQAQANQESK